MDTTGLLLVGQHHDLLEQLGDEEPSTKLEAQAVIEGIRIKKGYLDQDTLDDLNSIRSTSRHNLLRIVEQKQEIEAAYTKSISEQLYSSKYRFLYELIQNADDLQYSNARSQKKIPLLDFTLRPHTLTVETNEDGFTRKNIEAICATGQSSKKATVVDNHIGEKGFGFKSVFSVANEVKIQSGLWSFLFKHRRGESGLGMVTPLDAPEEELQSFVTTRITLKLTDGTRNEYKKLVDAVLDMPSTTISFLRKLKLIRFKIYQQDGQLETIKIKRKLSTNGSYTITRSRESNGAVEHDESTYHKFKHTINDMPQDDRRTGVHSTEIELAFPINPNTLQPKLSDLGQHTFAYLPLQRLPQIQFLIHSDFITSASRESIIDCDWNERICQGVAKAFTIAVDKFTTPTHPLKYSWLDYLPKKPMENPWKRLYSTIKTLLQTMPILESREQRQWKRPSQLRWLRPMYLHKTEPILEDTWEDIYLAPEYASTDLMTLKDLGVQDLNWAEILARTQADLVNTRSRIRTRPPEDPWHVSFASLGLAALAGVFGMSDSQQTQFKQLAIIPLSKPNQWTGAPGMGRGGLKKIYFPCTGTTPIPEDIGLHLMDKYASTNPIRKGFYKALGVEECSKARVFRKIELAHTKNESPLDFTSHFTYLFYISGYPEDKKRMLRAPTEDGPSQLVSARFYYPTNDPFDTAQLLTSCMRQKISFDINILSRSLVELERTPRLVGVYQVGQTWQDWLRELTDARYYPSLLRDSKDPDEKFSYPGDLSPVLKAILHHNPHKFLGTLKAHWHVYEDDMWDVCDELRDCLVPCMFESTAALDSTYMPTVEVLESLRKLGLAEYTDQISILKLPEGNLTDAEYRQWRFLEDLGVRSKPDLNFYELALEEIIYDETVTLDIMKLLYSSMARLATIQDQQHLRNFFSEMPYIRDPDADEGWVFINYCVWKGPEFLSHTSVLSSKYSGDLTLENFFTKALDIPDWSVGTILNELSTWSESEEDTREFNTSREIYAYLNDHVRNELEWNEIREQFKSKRLVLDADGIWHKLETCLWKLPFSLSGYVDLQSIYPSLEDFFTRKLKVHKVSPTMLINEIKRMAEQAHPHIEDIRHRLIETGMMLTNHMVDSNLETALQNLQGVKFLPKRLADGALTLVGVKDDFAILDHARYGKALDGKGLLLDFSIEETQILDVIFQHLRLTHRYLSIAITEETKVGTVANANEALSRQLRDKAYALYCCAAKHKSRKALRDDIVLFDQLREAKVYTTDAITTLLVLQLKAGPLKVPSKKSFLHYEIADGRLKVYVPEDQNQRRVCHRTQLPKLLSVITETGPAAVHDLSLILSCNLRDIYDVLQEEDISEVSWIEKPVLDLPESEEIVPSIEEVPGLQVLEFNSNNEPNVEVRLSTRYSRQRSRGPPVSVAVDVEEYSSTDWTSEYRRLLSQLINVAGQLLGPDRRVHALHDDQIHFNTFETFGSRQRDERAYNLRVGAAGEAFVFEHLSALDLANFTRENWQSTIRGTVALHTRYENLQDWRGRETTDFVYMDRNGSLTRYLRNYCVGDFPGEISPDHDHEIHPIEYFLEVKTTTGPCDTRFYMSNPQYERMKAMAFGDSELPRKVYVILRVFDIVTPNVGLKIFVDPWKLRGIHLDFEAEQWFGNTR